LVSDELCQLLNQSVWSNAQNMGDADVKEMITWLVDGFSREVNFPATGIVFFWLVSGRAQQLAATSELLSRRALFVSVIGLNCLFYV
jgi:hypothetical protein